MAEGNAAVADRIWNDVWMGGNLAVVDEVMTERCIGHDPAAPAALRGPAGFKEYVSIYRSALPDLQFVIEDRIVGDDKVVDRWRSHGTHQGELMGFAPTGRPTTATGILIVRFEDGKAAEWWVEWDNLGFSQQIGAAPRPGSAGERIGKLLQRLTAGRAWKR